MNLLELALADTTDGTQTSTCFYMVTRVDEGPQKHLWWIKAMTLMKIVTRVMAVAVI